MKGKRLLILGAAFALGLSACANSATMVRKTPLKADSGAPYYSLTTSTATGDNASPHNSYAAAADTTVDGIEWSVMGNSYMTPWRIGGKNTTNTDRPTYTKTAMGSDINRIVYKHSGITNGSNSSMTVNSIKLDVSSDSSFSNILETLTISDHSFVSDGEVEFVPTLSAAKWDSGAFYKFTINYKITGSNNCYFKLNGIDFYAPASGSEFGTLDHIKVKTQATKTTFEVGETFSSAGLSLIAYDDADEETANSKTVSSGFTVSFSNYVFLEQDIGIQNVTVSYEGKSTSYYITVEAATNFGTEDNPLSVDEALAVINKYGSQTTREIMYVRGVVYSSTYSTQYSNFDHLWLQSDDGETHEALDVFRSVLDSSITGDYTATDALKGYEIVAKGYGVLYNNTTPELTKSNNVTPTVLSLKAPANITLNKYSLDLEVGEEEQLVATLPDGVSGQITWASSDSNIASVDNDGNVEALAVGEVAITATLGSLSASCEVTITAATNYGTQENPLNIAGAIAAIDKNPAQTKKPLYVKGTISEASYSSKYSNYTVWLQSDDGTIAQAFELYALAIDADEFGDFSEDASALVGYEITVTGYGALYNNTKYELTYVTVDGNRVDPTTIALKAPSLSPSEQINLLDSRTSLSYNYSKTESGVAGNDALNLSFTGVSGSSYTDWSNKVGASGAVYAGQSAGGNDAIQLRTKNSNSGIVTTVSGGTVAKISVTWNANTTSGNKLDIYGKDTAYSSPTELYSASTQGTKIGTIECGAEETEITVEGEYQYIGLRSNNNAIYLDEIVVEWSGSVSYNFSYENVGIRFGGFLSKTLWDDFRTEYGIQGYGVELASTGNVDEDFFTELTESKLNPSLASAAQKAQQKVEDPENPYYVWNLYVKISNDDLKREFTAKAYIKDSNGDKTYFKEVTFSAKSLAKYLLDNSVYGAGEFEGSLNNLANL